KLARLTSRDLLLHRSGLPGWLPVHHATYSDYARHVLNQKYFTTAASASQGENVVAVGPGLYGTPALGKLVDQKLKQTEIRRSGRFRYSDVGFLLLGRVLESVSGKTLDQLSAYLFYRSMGMSRTGFNPHRWGLGYACPPTEIDQRWRKTTIKGYVHDPTAACLGGVAGHAGLFSNSYDLAKLMLMLKNGGNYGGRQYLRPETIQSFTRKQSRQSHRGLGWDKPNTLSSAHRPISQFASASTYGHTGFTGTCMWVDPVKDLAFVFLSNRTYPNVGNRKLQQEHVREKIMDQVYLSLQMEEHPVMANQAQVKP
ncbi:MAG: serine hydrolase, partial [Bacteroidota bacterium]